MIRIVTPTEIDKLAEFIGCEDTGFEGDLIAELKPEAKKILTYEAENQIKGFAYATLSINEGRGNEANLKVYVTPSLRRKGIGTELYKALLRQLEEENPDVLITFMRVDLEDPSPFWQLRKHKSFLTA